MRSPQALLAARSALVTAEPGHELRVHGWLEVARPIVCVLTDGATRGAPARLDSTVRVLEQAGARPTTILGRFSCDEVYQALLRHDIEFFDGVVEELAETFVEHDIEFVLSDAAEGHVLTHDLARYLVDAAVARASSRMPEPIDSYEFAVGAAPDSCPADLRYRSLRLHLYDEAFDRKLEAAMDYPQLKGQVNNAFREFGPEAFRVECFWPASKATTDSPNAIPAWERRGEELVASGVYREAVRYREHLLPLRHALEPAARMVA